MVNCNVETIALEALGATRATFHPGIVVWSWPFAQMAGQVSKPVILSPSPVILSEAKNLRSWLRVNSAKDPRSCFLG